LLFCFELVDGCKELEPAMTMIKAQVTSEPSCYPIKCKVKQADAHTMYGVASYFFGEYIRTIRSWRPKLD